MGLHDVCRRTFLGLLGTALASLAIVVALDADRIASLLRRLLAAVAVLVLAGASSGVARANELAASARPVAPGIAIHGAGETMREYCQQDGAGRLWLVLPGGARFELVTSVADPSITNKGDGSFHVFDPSEVRGALAAVHYPLGSLAANVFILPYPRRGGLESAAAPGLILLSPGVVPLTREHQHAEFVHELGHLVQYARMPDGDIATWSAYRSLRGIADVSFYYGSAAHADRPHEIFAEDFRALFGDPLANSTGTVENSTLTPPTQIPGLGDFLRGLTDAPLPAALAAWPNPARGPVQFARAGASAPLDLFDITGRRVATVQPQMISGGQRWTWNGRDAAGRPLTGTVVFARVRGAAGPATRVTLVR